MELKKLQMAFAPRTSGGTLMVMDILQSRDISSPNSLWSMDNAAVALGPKGRGTHAIAKYVEEKKKIRYAQRLSPPPSLRLPREYLPVTSCQQTSLPSPGTGSRRQGALTRVPH